MDFRFLYREDKGRIGRSLWWRAVLPLALAWALAVALFQAFGHFSLGDPSALVLHDAEGNAEKLHQLGDGSILIFPTAILAVVSIIVGVCYYFASAKRYQDIGKAGALGVVLPLAVLLTASVHWMGPQLHGAMPGWIVYVFDLLLLAIAAWSIADLGFKDSK